MVVPLIQLLWSFPRGLETPGLARGGSCGVAKGDASPQPRGDCGDRTGHWELNWCWVGGHCVTQVLYPPCS